MQVSFFNQVFRIHWGFFSKQKPTPPPNNVCVCVCIKVKRVGHKTKDTTFIFPHKNTKLGIRTRNYNLCLPLFQGASTPATCLVSVPFPTLLLVPPSTEWKESLFILN